MEEQQEGRRRRFNVWKEHFAKEDSEDSQDSYYKALSEDFDENDKPYLKALFELLQALQQNILKQSF